MTASAGSRTLEVKVLSAEGLTVDRKPVTKNVFVEVRAETLNCSTTSPGTAEGARGNPSWNETLMVEMPPHARSITFDVKCKTSMGAKSVGIARIALSDFLGGIVPESCQQFLSYRLRDWEGRRNGIINFSVRVKSAQTPKYECPLRRRREERHWRTEVLAGIK
ncbi:BON1-associated protein 2-like [Prosopis cineraria]|uniref:BON1-associated protein 2-like n=1 Tax=Prosopis cineraria TaxID=364024 RepID=UPI00240F049C|nr:BON1-associated protein 2-like [Prosopis cineraria]